MGVREKIPRANKGDRRLGHTDWKRRASVPLRASEQCAKVPEAGTKAEGDTRGHRGQMKAEGDRVGMVAHNAMLGPLQRLLRVCH